MDQAHHLPYAYYRYVDDVWGIWTHGEETLRRFRELANTIHPHIQVTLRFSKKAVRVPGCPYINHKQCSNN